MTAPHRAAAVRAPARRWRSGSAPAAAARPDRRRRRPARGWAGLRARWQSWWLARHPVSDTWTLGQHNIYILPTRGGWVFALTLLVMLASAINYQLNLGYVLTFLLAGAAAVSIHTTHATLRGLTLRLRPPPPVFAGEPARLEVVVSNPGRARHGIGLRLHARRRAPHPAWCDVPALGQASAALSFVPRTRGWHALPALLVETRFPFGLFSAWTHWRPAGQLLAYPRHEAGAPPLPSASGSGGGPSLPRQGPGGEIDGVRTWRRGDALRQIAWKKVARGGPLVSRDTTAETRRELWLEWPATAAAGDVEARLSRLAEWVLAAERDGRRYGLRLPGRSIAADRGDAHQRRLLRELALWR
ncbi:MAG TPA: DUF58 domain-containing protein [Rubrivivax sp.]|nr:DUF58 domain-containing protein [Rubrivivax sp.]